VTAPISNTADGPTINTYKPVRWLMMSATQRGQILYRRHQRQRGESIDCQQQRKRPRPNRVDSDVRDGECRGP